MKVWQSQASEHSANLVMIGRFKDANKAALMTEAFGELQEQAAEDNKDGSISMGGGTTRYSEPMMKLLSRLRLHSIGPAELEQFLYDVRISAENSEVVLTTDENDVSAFLKALIDWGARVEVYSAHEYPDTNHGR